MIILHIIEVYVDELILMIQSTYLSVLRPFGIALLRVTHSVLSPFTITVHSREYPVSLKKLSRDVSCRISARR